MLPGRSYKVETCAVDEFGVRFFYSQTFDTLPKHFQPKPVTFLGVESFVPAKDLVDAIVYWTPSSGKKIKML